jgi:hypothetical protein
MPPCHWFSVALTVEEFFPPYPLRIFGIPDLELSAGISVGHVRRILLLGNNAFQIEPTNLLK